MSSGASSTASVQRPPRIDNRRPCPRWLYRGLRSRDDRLALGAGKSAVAADRHRDPLARRRSDFHAVHRRLRLLGGVRSLEPQGDHADWSGRHDILHIDDPFGSKRRAADHRAPANRFWGRFCRLGGVSDRRGIDAGAAPAHLWGNLRDGAGDLVHRGAVYRLPAHRQTKTRSGFWHCRADWR
jgi:hypothetical protein